MEQSSYRTIGRPCECDFVERRSHFIGAVCPACNQHDAQEFIDERKKKYWNASHNVFAYVLRDERSQRFSDDGEPQGTAGLPVLDVLLREELTDSVIVVTRFFGGILLGTGGLVRAYTHCAKLAVEAGGVVVMRLCTRGVIKCEYTIYGRIDATVLNNGGIIKDTRFSESVEIEFIIPCEYMDKFKTELTEISSGSVSVCEIGQEYAAF